jgi:hypothetical protein
MLGLPHALGARGLWAGAAVYSVGAVLAGLGR